MSAYIFTRFHTRTTLLGARCLTFVSTQNNTRSHFSVHSWPLKFNLRPLKKQRRFFFTWNQIKFDYITDSHLRNIFHKYPYKCDHNSAVDCTAPCILRRLTSRARNKTFLSFDLCGHTTDLDNTRHNTLLAILIATFSQTLMLTLGYSTLAWRMAIESFRLFVTSNRLIWLTFVGVCCQKIIIKS